MPSMTLRRLIAASHPRTFRRIALCWVVGNLALALGCVSQQTYNSARQEVTEQSAALAQTQSEIQSLEQQREDAHAANKRDEQTLADLKNEIGKIRASYDQIQKVNQARLAALQHSIATLRARHQAMVKEISDTKRYERQLQAITEQAHKAAQQSAESEAHVILMESAPQEPRQVAVITPQSNREDNQAAPVVTTPPQPLDKQIAGMTAPAAAPQATTAIITTSAAPGAPVKPAPVTTSSPAPTAPSAPQDDSWFSSLTGWLTSLFDWLWT